MNFNSLRGTSSVLLTIKDAHYWCVKNKTLLARKFSTQCAAQKEEGSSGDRKPALLGVIPDVSKEEFDILDQVFEEVATDTENLPHISKTAGFANPRLKSLVKYLLPNGPTCGAVFLMADRWYAKQRRLSNKLLKDEAEQYKKACRVFWAMEMQMSSLILQDDIMDSNGGRSNLKSWHTIGGTGLQAIRDSHVLTVGSFHLLRKYFKTEEYYFDLVEEFFESIHRVDVGLSQLEMIRPSLMPPGTPEPMKLLIAGKEYGYGAYLPYGAVAMAMIINGAKARVPELMKSVEEIGFEAGVICGITEDYLDCYADLSVNERATTDIPEGKLTWMYLKALEMGTPSQAQLLQDSYGKYDDDCIATVKRIYKELGIQEYMHQMFDEMEASVRNKISKMPQEDVPWGAYLFIIDYFRQCRNGKYGRP